MRFASTLPHDTPDLDRLSGFARWIEDRQPQQAASSRLAGLSGSLWQDLWHEPAASPRRRGPSAGPPWPQAGTAGHWLDVVQVLAASLRHAQALTLHLGCEGRVVPLTLYPLQRLARCPLDVARIEAMRLADLRVLHVEPALLPEPGLALAQAAGNLRHCQPLAPIGWLLALRGPRREVLPELGGALACRRVPGLALHTPGLCGAAALALQRLGGQAASLRTLASWPGMDAVRAARLVNGLYLQGGLIVSRTHPAARAR